MNLENWWLKALWSLLPTVITGLIFWFVIRAIMNADRNERKMMAKVEAEERAKLAAKRADG